MARPHALLINDDAGEPGPSKASESIESYILMRLRWHRGWDTSELPRCASARDEPERAPPVSGCAGEGLVAGALAMSVRVCALTCVRA